MAKWPPQLEQHVRTCMRWMAGGAPPSVLPPPLTDYPSPLSTQDSGQLPSPAQPGRATIRITSSIFESPAAAVL